MGLALTFQFQTGSIKSNLFAIFSVHNLTMFQFQTGSIKRTRKQDRRYLLISVSIPNWFD